MMKASFFMKSREPDPPTELAAPQLANSDVPTTVLKLEPSVIEVGGMSNNNSDSSVSTNSHSITSVDSDLIAQPSTFTDHHQQNISPTLPVQNGGGGDLMNNSNYNNNHSSAVQSDVMMVDSTADSVKQEIIVAGDLPTSDHDVVMEQDSSAKQSNVVKIETDDDHQTHLPADSSRIAVDEPAPAGPVVKMEIGDDSLPCTPTPPAEPVEYEDPCLPIYDQNVHVISSGPGSKREAPLLGIGLPAIDCKSADMIFKAKKYAMDQSLKHVLLKQQLQHQQQQMISLKENIQKQQAIQLMCTIYIGSISYELREESVRTSFGAFGPVKSINMSFDPSTGRHMGFAFVEFEVPEAADLSITHMNGLFIGGRNLKVGRPSNMPQAQPIIESVMAEAMQHHRIYVASIHEDISESDLRSVFEAFGNVLSCQVAQAQSMLDNKGKHKGFGYIEYDNEQSAIEAINSMNLFDLGGMNLRVGRAITPPNLMALMQQSMTQQPQPAGPMPSASAIAAAHATAHIQALQTEKPMGGRLSAAPKIYITGQEIPGMVAEPGSIFVPPPGVAIPQIAAPQIVTPQIYSIPTTTTGKSRFSSASNSPVHPGSFPASAPPPSTTGFEATRLAAITRPAGMSTIGQAPAPATPLASFTTPAPAHPTPNAINQPNPAPHKPGSAAARAASSYYKVPSGGPKAIANHAAGGRDPSSALAVIPSGGTVALVKGAGGGKNKKKKGKGKGGGGGGGSQQQQGVVQQPDDMAAVQVAPQVAGAPGQLRSTDAIAQKILSNASLNEKQRKLIEMEGTQTIAAQEDLKIKGNEARNVLMQKLMRRVESPVLVLRNMVGVEDVDEDLEPEILEECSKFGEVDQVIIYQERQGAAEDAPTIVKIFVKFSLPSEAETGREALDGRYFACRMVKADIYDEQLFLASDLSA